MSRYPLRNNPAYGGATCPWVDHSGVSRAPASARIAVGIAGPHEWVMHRVCRSAATRGAAISPGSWIIRSGSNSAASRARSRAIGGVARSPKIIGKTSAARSRPGTPELISPIRRTVSRTPVASSPPARASIPAAATWGQAGSGATQSTLWPARVNARASGTIGKTWPTPHVELNRTRTDVPSAR